MAQMRIDQAGLPSVPPGRARTDGLSNGALVTITDLTPGAITTTVRLLWVPPDDVTARPSLAPSGPTTWTFSPQAGTNGSYRIELISNLGLPTESRQIRIFGVRNPGGLLVPAANETANPEASLENVSATMISESENNEAFGPFTSGSAWGWWRALSEIANSGAPSWGGVGLRVLLKAADNSYTTQRIGVSEIGLAPTVNDDVGDGFLVGSWWVQLIPGEIPTPVLWDCHDNAAGAAVWQQRPLASTVAPSLVARAGVIGTSAQFARADHVHDVSLVTRGVSASATIVVGDEIIIVNTAAGPVTLTLPPVATRRYYSVKKTTTDANAIILRPNDTSGSGPSIEGGAAGADFPLPSSTVGRGYWFFFSDGTSWWIA